MVEMIETAAILNQATERSFVILDEVVRGTAPLPDVPKSVIRRAGELLKKFEKQSKKETFDSVQLADQMELVYAPVQDELRARVASIDPNNLTPIEALQLIYELKKI